MKKKVILIVVSAVILLILCIGAGGYIWYANSPLPVAAALAEAIREKDIDSALEYIEPEAAQKIRLVLNIMGISPDDLAEKLPFDNYGGSDGIDSSENKVKFDSYVRSGDTASLSIQAAEKTITLNFKRIEGKWYLLLSSP